MTREILPLLKIVEDKENEEKYEELKNKIQVLLDDDDLFQTALMDMVRNGGSYLKPSSENYFEIIKNLLSDEELNKYSDIVSKKRDDLISMALKKYNDKFYPPNLKGKKLGRKEGFDVLSERFFDKNLR